MKNRVFALMLSLLLMLTFFTPAFAANGSPKAIEVFGGEIKEKTVNDIVTGGYVSAKKYAAYPLVTKQNPSAYALLNENEKKIFDYFVDSPFGTYEYEVSYSSADAPSYSYFTSIDVEKLMIALSMDCPELFYLGDVRWSYSYYDLNRSGGFNSGDTLASLNISFVQRYTAKKRNSLNEQLWAKVRSADFSACKNRYELVKAFHDYLCRIADYSSNLLNDSVYNVIGCFVNGDCVCQGYSEAFKLLCNYYNIPCVCIPGEADGVGHIWNAVPMKDGKWYLIDVTWDDPNDNSSPILYDYFLVGYETEIKTDKYNYLKFRESHVEIPEKGCPSVFCALDAYQTDGNENDRFDQTLYADELTEKQILKRFITDVNEPIFFNGLCLSQVNAKATGKTFSAPSGTGGANETWTLCLVGDADGNGKIDSADIHLVEKKASEGSAVETVYDEACDANSDGVIDASDVRLFKKFKYVPVSTYAETDSMVIFNLDHIFKSVTYSKKATCTEDGVRSGVCEVCGENVTEIIKAYGHNFSTSWTVDVEPSAVSSGEKSHHCTRCGERKDVTVIECTPPLTPANLKAVSYFDNTIKVSWSESVGASSYIVYRKENGSWVRKATTSSTTYIDSDVSHGKSYTYTVKAVGDMGTSDYKRSGVTSKFIASPTAISVANVYNGVLIKWSKVPNVDSYRLYRRIVTTDANGNTVYGAWNVALNTKDGSVVECRDTNRSKMKSGTVYQYCVRSLIDGEMGPINVSQTEILYLTAPVFTLTRKTAGINVKWSAVNGADYYRVYRRPAGSSTWKKLSKTTALTYTDQTAVKGQKYEYTVRAFVNGGESVYRCSSFTRKTVTR